MVKKVEFMKETNPQEFSHFEKGIFMIQRSNRFKDGPSPDLLIEQVLMQSIKTN